MAFTRKMGAERAVLVLPFNVVVVGRVRGNVNPTSVASALESLRRRHPLLAVRVRIDDDDKGWYVADDVPQFTIHSEKRQSEDQWIMHVKDELRGVFILGTGPLVRCAIVHSPEVSEVVLCAHHVVCDGMSLCYLLRDLLRVLAGSEEGLEECQAPPSIDSTTVPMLRRVNPVRRLVIGRINKKWTAKNFRFDDEAIRRLHTEFWKKNEQLQVLAWSMDVAATSALVARSRSERVTVNAALWTAFLAAQYEVQGRGRRYRRRSGLAVSTRDKLDVPAGEAFGFYASSLTVDLSYDPKCSFWDNARRAHSTITRELARTDLFRMLSAELIHPTLWDSLYLAKYGLLDETISRRVLRRMGWHEVTYGYALTNVGRLDIPTTYGPLQLEAVYGPAVYSDVDEKTVGVITVGGRLTCIMTFDEHKVSNGGLLRDVSLRQLDEAMRRSQTSCWAGLSREASQSSSVYAWPRACSPGILKDDAR
jgi:NRPS condensation-like uncharacterized protein